MLGEAKKTMRSLVGPAMEWFSIPLLTYFFFLSTSLPGIPLNILGGGVLTELISLTSNPFVSLFVGILATSIVQSWSSVHMSDFREHARNQ